MGQTIQSTDSRWRVRGRLGISARIRFRNRAVEQTGPAGAGSRRSPTRHWRLRAQRGGVVVGAHAVAAAPDVEDAGVADETVDDGGGHDLVGKDLAPVGEAAVAGEDDGALLVATADDLEDPVGRGLVQGQVAELIDD